MFLCPLKVPSGQIGSAWEWYHWKALQSHTISQLVTQDRFLDKHLELQVTLHQCCPIWSPGLGTAIRNRVFFTRMVVAVCPLAGIGSSRFLPILEIILAFLLKRLLHGMNAHRFFCARCSPARRSPSALVYSFSSTHFMSWFPARSRRESCIPSAASPSTALWIGSSLQYKTICRKMAYGELSMTNTNTCASLLINCFWTSQVSQCMSVT